MFIKVSKTMHLYICGTIHIRIHTRPNSWYNYWYSAEYFQPPGTALSYSTKFFTDDLYRIWYYCEHQTWCSYM